ncbi:MAG: cytoplasmic protein [Desulfosarcina sp.]|nr:cytoplasmic protein [Desulfosarcina sp.]MBC2741924.1 cytoplasmic protein [Desulfosarcina sp.]MBC2764837.1 cytoplasmic protein [Desulfosarcina sp.]
MTEQEQIDFIVDTNNLYREDAITDLKVASIRRMIPITADGKDDPSRTPTFFGHTQILTPQGPLPLQARLMANNLTEAMEAFPEAMEQEMAQMVKQIRKMQEEEQKKQRDDARIIVPGR